MRKRHKPERVVSPAHGIAKRNARDRRARYTIFVGGMLMIVSVLAIFVFLLSEVAPLLGGASVEMEEARETSIEQPQVVFSDEYRTHAIVMGARGHYLALPIAGGAPGFRGQLPLEDGEKVTGVDSAPGHDVLTAATNRGRVLLQPVGFAQSSEGAEAGAVTARLEEPASVRVDPQGRAIRCYAVQLGESGTTGIVAQLADGSLRLSLRTVEENPFTGEKEIQESVFDGPVEARLTHLLLSGDYRQVYGALEDGRLVWWNVHGGEFGATQFGIVPPERHGQQPSRVTALEFLLGGESLLVGREDGSTSIWFRVRVTEGRNDFDLTQIREYPALEGRIVAIAASRRNKGFLVLGETGSFAVCYSTTGDVDWRGRTDVPSPGAIAYSPKGDGILVAGNGQVAVYELENPHPDVSLATLFTKVWYENAKQPAYEWQSTGASEAYEAKMSFMPLIVGTIKGTLFSMILSIPVAVLGAMYVSQFMHFSLRRYIKPIIEIMAAIPSVVLGFLAAIWLAPRVEAFFTSLILMGIFLPILIVAAGFLWQRWLPVGLRARSPDGIESLLFIGVILLGGWLCLLVGPVVEQLLFDGTLVDYLISKDGLDVPYEQRNAVVVGLAMSFAVIPIIFSISEDSFSNVPRTLVSGSLALGADRWQTVTRVVLPTASPGIFSAAMVGFGRAVGETMIVLMATGNTPIMDLNPFSGFLALSANIATEIPEAPQGGTLYRTLFLSGLVLFAFTFFINTLAEVVRFRLRRRYANL